VRRAFRAVPDCHLESQQGVYGKGCGLGSYHQYGWGKRARPGAGYEAVNEVARTFAALSRAAGAAGSEAACAAAVEAAIWATAEIALAKNINMSAMKNTMRYDNEKSVNVLIMQY
jgi:hypothetical protein